MIYCLDTNVCIFLLKGVHPALARRFLACEPSQLFVPAIVVAELLLGCEKSNRPKEALRQVRAFLEPLRVWPFDQKAAEAYAVIRAALEKKGEPIGSEDLIIGATALAGGATLITNNTRKFQRVPGLRVEDWTKA